MYDIGGLHNAAVNATDTFPSRDCSILQSICDGCELSSSGSSDVSRIIGIALGVAVPTVAVLLSVWFCIIRWQRRHKNATGGMTLRMKKVDFGQAKEEDFVFADEFNDYVALFEVKLDTLEISKFMLNIAHNRQH